MLTQRTKQAHAGLGAEPVCRTRALSFPRCPGTVAWIVESCWSSGFEQGPGSGGSGSPPPRLVLHSPFPRGSSASFRSLETSRCWCLRKGFWSWDLSKTGSAITLHEGHRGQSRLLRRCRLALPPRSDSPAGQSSCHLSGPLPTCRRGLEAVEGRAPGQRVGCCLPGGSEVGQPHVDAAVVGGGGPEGLG